MSIQLKEEDGGRRLIVQVTGTLVAADYTLFAPEVDRLVGQFGKLRLLFDMTGLKGWDAGAMWEDTKFAIKHFADLERIAIVGDTKWEQAMALLCKPFTMATVRYFDHTKLAEARKWLGKVKRPVTPNAAVAPNRIEG